MTRREFNHHVREERICENDLIDTLRRMNNHYLRLKQGQSDAMISLSPSHENNMLKKLSFHLHFCKYRSSLFTEMITIERRKIR